jgi:predicted DNA binding CopG/RHH family protein
MAIGMVLLASYSRRSRKRAASSSVFKAGNFLAARFEFERKSKNISTRIPATLLDAVKAQAARQGIPYQRFIRQTLVRFVTRDFLN